MKTTISVIISLLWLVNQFLISIIQPDGEPQLCQNDFFR